MRLLRSFLITWAILQFAFALAAAASSPAATTAPPWSEVLRVAATRVVPAGLAVGACMEGFMYVTGFWSVALRKERERRDAAAAAPPPPPLPLPPFLR